MTELLSDEIASALGTIRIAAAGGALVGVDFEDSEERMIASLERRFGAVKLKPRRDPFGHAGRLRAFLAGDLLAVAGIPVEARGTPFERRVWLALRDIPPGSTVTYGELAARIGRPGAARAVGLANSRNPVAIVVPCHRVIGAHGRLTGYAGGLDRKRWLLEHEGAFPAPRAAIAFA